LTNAFVPIQGLEYTQIASLSESKKR